MDDFHFFLWFSLEFFRGHIQRNSADILHYTLCYDIVVQEGLKNGLEEGVSQCLHERSVCSDSADPAVTVTSDSWAVSQVCLYAGKSCSPSLSSVRMIFFSYPIHHRCLLSSVNGIGTYRSYICETVRWKMVLKSLFILSKLNRIQTWHQEIVCDYPCWLLVTCPRTVSDHINNLRFGQWQNCGWQHR